MHWSEVWFGNTTSAKAIRVALTPASWLYGLGWKSYLSLYELGLKEAKRPHQPLICVGNLTVGGSGKTPLTLYLSQLLVSLGYRAAISCSGYGSPASEEATVAEQGELPASAWGDEAALVRMELPDVPLIVGRNRVRAAELCASHLPDHILLLDDGFQHLPLAKDVTILLDPDTSNDRCLPAGPYREPRSCRSRASTVLPGEFQAVPSALCFTDPHGAGIDPPEKVAVLCALGNPQQFVDSVRSLGVQIVQAVLKPDHARLDAGNLFEAFAPGMPIVVTTKDWVKLRTRADISQHPIIIARRSVRIAPEADFAEWIVRKLNEIAAKRT